MPKVKVSLAQRSRSHRASACAACAPRDAPSIFNKMDRYFFSLLFRFLEKQFEN
jgi:hypothetical protein